MSASCCSCVASPGSQWPRGVFAPWRLPALWTLFGSVPMSFGEWELHKLRRQRASLQEDRIKMLTYLVEMHEMRIARSHITDNKVNA